MIPFALNAQPTFAFASIVVAITCFCGPAHLSGLQYLIVGNFFIGQQWSTHALLDCSMLAVLSVMCCSLQVRPCLGTLCLAFKVCCTAMQSSNCNCHSMLPLHLWADFATLQIVSGPAPIPTATPCHKDHSGLCKWV